MLYPSGASSTTPSGGGSTSPAGSGFSGQPVTAPPSAQSLAATGSIQFTAIGGSTVALTVTHAPAATTAFNATVNFEWSPDGSTWYTLSATPKSSLPGASAVAATSTTVAGLWIASLPSSAVAVRYRISAWVSGTVWTFVEPWAGQNGVVVLPWSPTVTSGQTLAGWFDTSGLNELLLRFSAITTCVVTVQGTNDPSGTDVVGIAAQDAVTANATSTATITAAGTYRVHLQGWKWVRVQVTTTGTVLTVQGFAAAMGQTLGLTSIGNSVYITTNNATFSLGQIAGTTTVTAGVAGLLAVGGNIAHSSAGTSNPLPGGGRVTPTTIAGIDVSLAAGDASHAGMTTGYQTTTKDFATAELDWSGPVSFTPTQWASAATLTQLRAASGTANVRTYITGLQLSTDALGAATSLWILDGAVAVSSATVATPGVFTSGTHDFKVGDAIVFQGLSGLAITGVVANQVVYVVTVPSTTTFTVALTRGGTGVQVTVTGTATVYRILKQLRLQTTALPPADFHFPSPLRSAPNVAVSCIASGTTTGTIYPDVGGYYGF